MKKYEKITARKERRRKWNERKQEPEEKKVISQTKKPTITETDFTAL